MEAGPRQDDLGSNIIQDVNDDEDQDSDEDEFEEEEIAEGNGPLSHHAIWNRLLNYAARLGTYSMYTSNTKSFIMNEYLWLKAYAPAHGKTPGDVTAFEPSSASWGKDQADRPPVLSLWMSRPGDAPTYTLESLKYRGRIVQDWEGKDIQTFRGLPLTIASTIEGFRVEAWLRADHRMKYRDIVARMRTRDGPDRRVPIYKERALASRAVGFRDHAGCIAWHSLSGNMQGQTYMDSLRTPYQRANNLITGSDLTMDQLREFRSLTRKSQGQTTPAVVPTGVSATPGSSTLRPRRATNIRTYHVISSDNSDEEAPVDAPDEPTDPPKPSPEISESDSSSSGVEIPWDSARSPYPILSPSESSSSSSEAESSGDSSSLSRLESDREADPSRSPHSRLQEDSDTNTSTASPSSEPENPADVRNLRPRDMDEGIILSAALWRTREHFKELTGRKAPQVPLMENYFSQWATLQEHLRSLWTSQGRGGNVPLLYGLDAWVGSIGNWRSAAPARTNYVVAGGGGSA